MHAGAPVVTVPRAVVAPSSVNHIRPSGPSVMSAGWLPASSPRENSRTPPVGRGPADRRV